MFRSWISGSGSASVGSSSSRRHNNNNSSSGHRHDDELTTMAATATALHQQQRQRQQQERQRQQERGAFPTVHDNHNNIIDDTLMDASNTTISSTLKPKRSSKSSSRTTSTKVSTRRRSRRATSSKSTIAAIATSSVTASQSASAAPLSTSAAPLSTSASALSPRKSKSKSKSKRSSSTKSSSKSFPSRSVSAAAVTTPTTATTHSSSRRRKKSKPFVGSRIVQKPTPSAEDETGAFPSLRTTSTATTTTTGPKSRRRTTTNTLRHVPPRSTSMPAAYYPVGRTVQEDLRGSDAAQPQRQPTSLRQLDHPSEATESTARPSDGTSLQAFSSSSYSQDSYDRESHSTTDTDDQQSTTNDQNDDQDSASTNSNSSTLNKYGLIKILDESSEDEDETSLFVASKSMSEDSLDMVSSRSDSVSTHNSQRDYLAVVPRRSTHDVQNNDDNHSSSNNNSNNNSLPLLQLQQQPLTGSASSSDDEDDDDEEKQALDDGRFPVARTTPEKMERLLHTIHSQSQSPQASLSSPVSAATTTSQLKSSSPELEQLQERHDQEQQQQHHDPFTDDSHTNSDCVDLELGQPTLLFSSKDDRQQMVASRPHGTLVRNNQRSRTISSVSSMTQRQQQQQQRRTWMTMSAALVVGATPLGLCWAFRTAIFASLSVLSAMPLLTTSVLNMVCCTALAWRWNVRRQDDTERAALLQRDQEVLRLQLQRGRAQQAELQSHVYAQQAQRGLLERRTTLLQQLRDHALEIRRRQHEQVVWCTVQIILHHQTHVQKKKQQQSRNKSMTTTTSQKTGTPRRRARLDSSDHASVGETSVQSSHSTQSLPVQSSNKRKDRASRWIKSAATPPQKSLPRRSPTATTTTTTNDESTLSSSCLHPLALEWLSTRWSRIPGVTLIDPSWGCPRSQPPQPPQVTPTALIRSTRTALKYEMPRAGPQDI